MSDVIDDWWEDFLSRQTPEQRAGYEQAAAWEADLERRMRGAVEVATHAAVERWGVEYGLDVVRETAAHVSEASYPDEWEDVAARNAERARKTKRPIVGRLRTQVFERDMYRCVHCGTHKDLSVDHIIPESAGGPATLDNLQTLCRSCNSKKGTKQSGASGAHD